MTSHGGRIADAIARQLGIPALTSVGFVHAHPDDETIVTGTLIAGLSAAGVKVHVLTVTRGERGEAVPGSVPAGTDAAQLAEIRELELARAVQVLGVSSQAWLGSPPALAASQPRRYTDSGMRWVSPGVAGPAEEKTPDAFTCANRGQILADIKAWFDATALDLVVSYAADGGYGHPDHVLAHLVTAEAAQHSQLPVGELVSPAQASTLTYDLPQNRATVVEALRQHRTQLRVLGADDAVEIEHVGGQREPIVLGGGLLLHSDRAQRL